MGGLQVQVTMTEPLEDAAATLQLILDIANSVGVQLRPQALDIHDSSFDLFRFAFRLGLSR